MNRWVVKFGPAYWTGPHIIVHDMSARRERAWVFATLASARTVARRLPVDAKVFRLVKRKVRR